MDLQACSQGGLYGQEAFRSRIRIQKKNMISDLEVSCLVNNDTWAMMFFPRVSAIRHLSILLAYGIIDQAL